MLKRYPTVLRCYARPEGDHYLALCLELGLCDQGPTLDAAKTSLEDSGRPRRYIPKGRPTRST